MARLPTPHPQSQTVLPAMLPSSFTQFSIFCIVMSCPLRMSNWTLLTSSESEYILFHRLKPSLLKYSRTSVLSSTVERRAVPTTASYDDDDDDAGTRRACEEGGEAGGENADAVRVAMPMDAAMTANAFEIFIVTSFRGGGSVLCIIVVCDGTVSERPSERRR